MLMATLTYTIGTSQLGRLLYQHQQGRYWQRGGDLPNTPAHAYGSVVAFQSTAKNLDPNIQTRGSTEVYVRNLSDASPKLVSVNHLGDDSGEGDVYGPVISADGNVVVFVSYASNLVEEGVDDEAGGHSNVYHRNIAS